MNGSLAKATLTCDEPKGKVEFFLNPETIKFTRKLKPNEKATASPNSGSPGGSLGMIFAGADMPSITLGKCQLEGPKCKDDIELIAKWMSPVTGDALAKYVAAAAQALSQAFGGEVSANQAAKFPEVLFTWGTGFLYPCNVEDLQSKFTRFDPKGMPTRAEITSMKLKWKPKFLNLTNPTSGGPAGRMSHVVTAGETVQSIAQNRYGQPAFWRALADMNGIDDPMRVHPGQKVYLPTTEELIRASRG